MINNREIGMMCKHYLTIKEIDKLIRRLKNIKIFIEDFSNNEIDITLKKQDIVNDLNLYKRSINSYIYEKEFVSGLKCRVVYKLGFVGYQTHIMTMIPFEHQNLILKNDDGVVQKNNLLGKNCAGLLSLCKKDVKDLTFFLAIVSQNHRDDVVKYIKRYKRKNDKDKKK